MRVIDGEVPSVKFFHTPTVTIRRRAVLMLRRGMAGPAGVKLSGPFEDEQIVRDAILKREPISACSRWA